MSKKIIINDCDECPFSGPDCTKTKSVCLAREDNKIIDEPEELPEWCPLLDD